MTSRKESKTIAAISSTLCSISSSLVTHPFQVVKIRQQSENQGKFLRLAFEVYKKEGLMTFYNGFSYAIATNGLSLGVYLYLYDSCKLMLLERYKGFHDEHKVIFPLITSGITRFITSSLFFPFECFKTVKQSMHGFSWVHFYQMFRQQGLKAYWITLQRDILATQIYWVFAENFKIFLSDRDVPDFYKNLLIGGVSGLLGAFITLPLDVIKTQKQTHLENSNKSYFQISKDIYQKNKGIKGFFLGYQARMLRVSTYGAVLMTTYEYFYKQIFTLYHSYD
ncbi:carrier protein (macronuclear) [Tetrahymena thermophila SB210]|uniref:Carrier protein n=1 Tax=Tetrahymena thermophila (strain SB210) TaxID=312017 RepID=I7MMX4_TETTS|nr:carrier protein [Tetrahymena thermophila SB210]EAS07157.2 carrier protein [Tetrahymena thermophila SB210]|eukprot:XP_001027399.2 carrier protein [Tetrahymena thermophila SB210]